MRFPDRLEITLAQLLEGRGDDLTGALVPSLRALQRATGWVSPEGLEEISLRVGVPVDDAANIADYFAMVRTPPAARHTLEVCVNGSCRRQGSEAVLRSLGARLGVEPGQVTPDGAFALVDIICLGRCGLGPSIRIDGEIREGFRADAVDALLADLTR
ncbi:MAG: NAD(P)H-dependent oxidoreductase subunit E [Byssovorax sp.]